MEPSSLHWSNILTLNIRREQQMVPHRKMPIMKDVIVP
jgi:hypothetical protein